MKFKQLCEFFQTVRDTKKYKEKGKIIEDHLKIFKEEIQKSNPNETLFPALRLMLPKLDRERESYNMKESRIGKIIIKMLQLPQQSNDRNMLTKSSFLGGGCDFASIVYSVIRKYIAHNESQLTIQELNSYLDDISNKKSESEAEDILLKMFRKSSPEDSSWIIRIILKELKLGIDGNAILNCFHKDASTLYSSNSNLKKLCETLSNPNVNLHELEINVFDIFRPMLSKKIDSATFKRHIPDKLFYVENKFDGERFQIHMKQNQFKYFSRNGFDYTEHFGATYKSGILTNKLKNVFNSDVNQIILDGEMMLWNRHTKKFGSKGMNLDVKALKTDLTYQPCFCVYDIILINDKILTNQPLKNRLKALRKAIKETTPGIFVISEHKECLTRKEIIDELNNSVDKEEEGIIVKDPDSIYKYSDRNSGWFKMKLEYFSDVMNDLDLILLGGSYSTTSKLINSFFVGVRADNVDKNKPVYFSFGKISSGLNDHQLEILNKKLKTQGFEFNKSTKTDEIIFGTDVPNYWIEPKNSCILHIRASELTRATKHYKTPYTFRFPRVLNVRDDKPVDECLTLSELLELSQNKSIVKLNKRRIELEEILNTKTREIKRPKLIVPNLYSSTVVTEILTDLTIYVLNGTTKQTKEEIESIVRQAGGTISYKLNDSIDIVLVGNRIPKISDIIGKRPKYDIINIDWLERSLSEGETVCYNHDEVYYIGWNYKNNLTDNVDMYGDSFTENATMDSLKRTFEIIKDMKEVSFPTEIYHKNFPQVFRFENLIAYFDKFDEINDTNSAVIYSSFLDELEFKYYHGIIHQVFTPNVNTIIFNGDEERKKYLQDFLNSAKLEDVQIVSKSFFYEQQAV